jgi:hypothetical protein
MLQQQAFDSGSVNNGINFFHSFNGAIMFHGVKERQISAGEVIVLCL